MLNMSLIQMFTKVIKPPPPIPWMTLPAWSMPILMLRAQTREPMKKSKFANSSAGFRPKISLIFPIEGMAAAPARRYVEPTHA